MSLSGFFASFCRVYLPWNVALAAYGLFLCLTGRFWQRNTSPLLRRVGHGVAIHCSLLPPLLPISWILAERFPRAYAALGALIPPAAGASALPVLRAVDWQALLGAVWAAGALACAAVRLLSRLRFRRWLREHRRPLGRRAAAILENVELQMDAMDALRPGDTLDERPRHRLRLTDRAQTRSAAYVVPGLPGPMCLMDSSGLFSDRNGRECLLLDREDYDEETLDAIFRHELSHIVPSGLWLWGYADSIAVLCWWNPGAWLLRRCLRAETELYCDAYANRGRSRERRAAYARTLTEMAARRRAFLPGMAQMSCGDRSLLRRRVRAVLEPPPHRRSIPLGALFLLIAALCAMLVLPLHSGGTRVTENTLLSFLHAPVRETAFFPAGLYGAAEVYSDGEGETAVLRLSYASPQDLAPGRDRLEAALTARLGPPRRRDAEMTIWQTLNADGNLTAVTLSRQDERTLTLK